ncbi:hypothetical protein [Hallerella porci]|uniref:HNH endonuclease n=1 Tax=Hallerella porci TaxID=1945871 RepID=A0ABX5LQP4_9BACT|nr:hypothetical protein [Hallerella porci]PWL03578.1 hypothetical protein B0H50_1042 [Hallerella porci]
MDLEIFFNRFNDFDIRINHDARYVDQKCTPDIVCFIADCILNTSCANKSFSINDLWEETFFEQNCRVVFGKPSPTDPKARNEYNKVLSQPLKLLAYAHVLNVVNQGRNLIFKVAEQKVLEFISIKERNAFQFLYFFFKAVVEQSGIKRFFDEYESMCKENPNLAKDTIYSRYHKFISANTPSQSKIDCDRMFHKVFNIFAFSKGLPGSNGKILNWYDLMYNRLNWRDTGKKKSETREESEKTKIKNINENFYLDYQVKKAIRLIKQMHGEISEVNDDLAAGKATEVHHIFPKSKYPLLAAYLENLILLTSSQHRQRAHVNSNFNTINPDYQLCCLLAKSRTIEKYIIANGETCYTKKAFTYIVNEGLEKKLIEDSDSFDVMRKRICYELLVSGKTF